MFRCTVLSFYASVTWSRAGTVNCAISHPPALLISKFAFTLVCSCPLDKGELFVAQAHISEKRRGYRWPRHSCYGTHGVNGGGQHLIDTQLELAKQRGALALPRCDFRLGRILLGRAGSILRNLSCA
jgi:hypothetical protein